jgi:hypothetical protein
MVNLIVYFEEGFFEDTVIIIANGIKVYEKQGVTTHAVVGLAESVEIEISRGPATIEVSIKNTNISKKIFIDISYPIHLAVSKRDKSLSHRISDKAFSYY